MIVAIHQPNFIPWIGYFAKIEASDIFVILDDAEYSKGSLINRNKIKINNSAHWLTVPIENVKYSIEESKNIYEIKIDNKQNWKKKHISTLKQYYNKSPNYINIVKMIEEVYSNEYEYLYELNIQLINQICVMLGIQKKMIFSSSLNVKSKSTERIIDIIKKLGANKYLSGHGAKSYQDENMFEKNNIELYYIDVTHTTYPQQGSGFIPSLSIIDYLFNVEKPNREILHCNLIKAGNEK